MFDPRAGIAGVSTSVQIGWVVWTAWGVALLGWYRYGRVLVSAVEPAPAPASAPAPVVSEPVHAMRPIQDTHRFFRDSADAEKTVHAVNGYRFTSHRADDTDDAAGSEEASAFPVPESTAASPDTARHYH